MQEADFLTDRTFDGYFSAQKPLRFLPPLANVSEQTIPAGVAVAYDPAAGGIIPVGGSRGAVGVTIEEVPPGSRTRVVTYGIVTVKAGDASTGLQQVSPIDGSFIQATNARYFGGYAFSYDSEKQTKVVLVRFG